MNGVERDQSIAIISIAFSMTVVLTVIMFPSMRRKKIFMPIIAMISLCDMMGNLPYAMGVCPSNGTTLCTFQSFLNLYFYPVSWLYTTILSYLLRGVFLHKKITLSEPMIHLPCWIIPLVLTLLLLTTSSYGKNNSHSCICSIKAGNVGILFHDVSYYGLLFLCSALMIFWSIEVFYGRYNSEDDSISNQHLRMGRVLLQYPIAMMILWLPYGIVCMVDPTDSDVFDATEGMKILHGAVTAIIFFANSKSARQQWMHVCCLKREIDVSTKDDDSDLESVMSKQQEEYSKSLVENRYDDRGSEMQLSSLSISSRF